MNFDQKMMVLSYLKEHGSITIHQVSDLCEISLPTARKILQILDNETIVTFNRGKAVSTSSFYDSTIKRRIYNNHEAKKKIAHYAASLVKDNQTIFIGGGSTTYGMLEYLIERQNITIVTNAIPIINFVINCQNINLIVIGGVWNRQTDSLENQEYLSNFYPDISFIGATALDPIRGITQETLMVQQTEIQLYNQSTNKYILADSSKFSIYFPWSILPSSRLQNIITDNDIQEKIISKFTTLGINIQVI